MADQIPTGTAAGTEPNAQELVLQNIYIKDSSFEAPSGPNLVALPPQLVAGPMLAFGLFTRLAACPIVIFLIVTNYERWRVGGFFWNKMGFEFTLLWTVTVFYFLIHGSGAISIDHLMIGREF